jgi:2-desacetyl-2-hydroxyethyl bacteriochlorophyllide A dehydrogenase
MRAVKFAAEGPIVTDYPAPDPKDGVLVRVHATGICGTDIGIIRLGGIPSVPGHEISGTISDATPVTIQPNLPCGSCRMCLTGRSNQCRESMAHFVGLADFDGGFAEELVVDPSLIRPLPDGMPLDLAALTEPTAVALHALDRLGTDGEQRLLIIGGGTIGIITAAMAVERGLAVTVTARHRHQQNAAESVGAKLSTADSPGEFTRVLDTAGSQSAMDLAYNLAEPGGRIVSIGGAEWHVATSDASLVKELSVSAAIIYTQPEFEQAIGWLAQRPELADTVITHRFSLEDALKAFETAAARGDTGAIKVMILP